MHTVWASPNAIARSSRSVVQHGEAPYVVRWGDSGHEALFFPGPDATIQHFEHSSQ